MVTKKSKAKAMYGRVLPFLIIFLFGALSMRVYYLISGVSTVFSIAQAEDEVSQPDQGGLSVPGAGDEHSPPEATEEKIAKAEIPSQHNDDKKENVEETQTPDNGEESSKWRAAGDITPEYSMIRKEVYEDLVDRRELLDTKEKDLHSREAILKAAELELERKYQELSQLRLKIENLLDKQSEEEKARVASLVKIYEGMKPKDAARIFDTLDLDVLVSVVSKMSERKLSPILAAMNPERARTITIMLAEQKKLPDLSGL